MDLSDIKTAVTSTSYNSKSSGNYSIKNWRLAALLASILFLTPCLVLSASSVKKQDLGYERWFEVELIVFTHKNRLALDSEKWPEITDLVLPEEMMELGQPIPKPPEEITPIKNQQDLFFEQVGQEGNSPMEDLKPIPMPVAFVMLRDEELQLKESLKKLTKSSKFDPLLHLAWRQPTYNDKHAQTVLLYEGMTNPEYTENKNLKTGKTARNTKSDIKNETNIEMINPRFAGTIRLSVARYLHFAADLVYRAPVTQRVANPMQDRELWTDSPYQALSYPQGPAYQLESWKAMRGFRLKESRRMRSKRIHYLDHPFLGIVVLITPVELPKDPEELSDTDHTQNISSGN
jgi:hypothetical protein